MFYIDGNRATRGPLAQAWAFLLQYLLPITLATGVVVLVSSIHVSSSQAADRSIWLEVKKGRLVRLAGPAKTVFVADPTVADVQVKSPTLVYVFGKSPGDTTLIAVDQNEKVLINANVTVALNLGQLRAYMRTVVPGGKIRVRSVGNSILLTGSVDNANQAQAAVALASRFVDPKNVINQIKMTGPTQVTLRVRVVEMSREAMRDLGVDWNLLIKQGSFLAGLITTGGAAAVTASVATRSLLGNNRYNVTAVLNALEQRNLLRVLAEPNLSAVSGHTAHFLAGGEFPIPVPQNEGVTTIAYKKFGVSLSFTPVIMTGNRISLKVAPEVSQLSSSGSITVGNVQVPALTTRRAETTLELASGQSLVIAGLLQRTSNTDLSQVPGIGNVPVVGKLFQSEKFKRNETELVIIVTPYLANPSSDNRPASPPKISKLPPYQNPKRLFKKYADSGKPAPKASVGKIGFIVE